MKIQIVIILLSFFGSLEIFSASMNSTDTIDLGDFADISSFEEVQKELEDFFGSSNASSSASILVLVPVPELPVVVSENFAIPLPIPRPAAVTSPSVADLTKDIALEEEKISATVNTYSLKKLPLSEQLFNKEILAKVVLKDNLKELIKIMNLHLVPKKIEQKRLQLLLDSVPECDLEQTLNQVTRFLIREKTTSPISYQSKYGATVLLLSKVLSVKKREEILKQAETFFYKTHHYKDTSQDRIIFLKTLLMFNDNKLRERVLELAKDFFEDSCVDASQGGSGKIEPEVVGRFIYVFFKLFSARSNTDSWEFILDAATTIFKEFNFKLKNNSSKYLVLKTLCEVVSNGKKASLDSLIEKLKFILGDANGVFSPDAFSDLVDAIQYAEKTKKIDAILTVALLNKNTLLDWQKIWKVGKRGRRKSCINTEIRSISSIIRACARLPHKTEEEKIAFITDPSLEALFQSYPDSNMRFFLISLFSYLTPPQMAILSMDLIDLVDILKALLNANLQERLSMMHFDELHARLARLQNVKITLHEARLQAEERLVDEERIDAEYYRLIIQILERPSNQALPQLVIGMPQLPVEELLVAHTEGVNVHKGEREERTKKACKLLWAQTGVLSETSIAKYFSYFQKKLESFPIELRRKVNRTLYTKNGKSFAGLCVGKITSCGLNTTGRELIARFVKFSLVRGKVTRIENETIFQSIVSALADADETLAYGDDSLASTLADPVNPSLWAVVCNPGKIQRLITAALQGYLTGVDIDELPVEEEASAAKIKVVTTPIAMQAFFNNEAMQKIANTPELIAAAMEFLKHNPAVDAEEFIKEITDYATYTFEDEIDDAPAEAVAIKKQKLEL